MLINRCPTTTTSRLSVFVSPRSSTDKTRKPSSSSSSSSSRWIGWRRDRRGKKRWRSIITITHFDDQQTLSFDIKSFHVEDKTFFLSRMFLFSFYFQSALLEENIFLSFFLSLQMNVCSFFSPSNLRCRSHRVRRRDPFEEKISTKKSSMKQEIEENIEEMLD